MYFSVIKMDLGESSTSRRSETPPVTQQTVESMARELQILRRAVSRGSVVNETNKPLPGDWLFFKDDRIISEFDPAKGNQSIDDWLKKINNCAHLCHWDEVNTIYLALGKLKGLARVWYDSLKNNQYSWLEWQEMLRQTFPSKMNFSSLFYEAATYKIESGQALRDYCFNKLAKLNRLDLKFSDAQIVDCVIAGISNEQIQLSLQAANCKNFAELTQKVINFSLVNNPSESQANMPGSSRGYRKQEKRSQDSTPYDNKRFKKERLKCFTCGEIGHKRSECPVRKKDDDSRLTCGFCHKYGHLEAACRRQAQPY